MRCECYPADGPEIVFDNQKWSAPLSSLQAAMIDKRAEQRIGFGTPSLSPLVTRDGSRTFGVTVQSGDSWKYRALAFRIDADGNLQWVSESPPYLDGNSAAKVEPPPQNVYLAIVPFSAPVESQLAMERSASVLLTPITLVIDLTIGVPYAIGYYVYYFMFDPRKLILV